MNILQKIALFSPLVLFSETVWAGCPEPVRANNGSELSRLNRNDDVQGSTIYYCHHDRPSNTSRNVLESDLVSGVAWDPQVGPGYASIGMGSTGERNAPLDARSINLSGFSVTDGASLRSNPISLGANERLLNFYMRYRAPTPGAREGTWWNEDPKKTAWCNSIDAFNKIDSYLRSNPRIFKIDGTQTPFSWNGSAFTAQVNLKNSKGKTLPATISIARLKSNNSGEFYVTTNYLFCVVSMKATVTLNTNQATNSGDFSVNLGIAP